MRSEICKCLFRTILVAYDGSQESAQALELARDIARAMSAKLFILGIEHLPNRNGVEAVRSAVEAARSRYQETFYRIRLAGMNEGLQVDTTIGVADPSSYVLGKAQQIHAALVVVGCGNDQRARSVCECIIAKASCPVMVVKTQN